MPATPTAAVGGRAGLVGDTLREQRADGARATCELVGRRRVRGEEPLGVADGAELEADVEVVEDQLGRAAADVDHERPGPQLASGGDAAPRQQRLVVARQHARREAVAPLDLAEERLAVLGLAHGARRDRERPLGPERLEDPPVVRERVAHARDRSGEEPAARVDALAEPRDPRLPVQLAVHPAVPDIGDEQPRRVRAEVDRGDPHLRGKNHAARPNVASTSSIASVSTRSRAIDRLSRPRLCSRRCVRVSVAAIFSAAASAPAATRSSSRTSVTAQPLEVAPGLERLRDEAHGGECERDSARDQRPVDEPVVHVPDRNRRDTGARIPSTSRGGAAR